MKRPTAVVAEVPPVVVTLTSTVPLPGGLMTVIRVPESPMTPGRAAEADRVAP